MTSFHRKMSKLKKTKTIQFVTIACCTFVRNFLPQERNHQILKSSSSFAFSTYIYAMACMGVVWLICEDVSLWPRCLEWKVSHVARRGTRARRNDLIVSYIIQVGGGNRQPEMKSRVITLHSDSQRLNLGCPFYETISIFYYMTIYGLICHIDIMVTFPKFSNHMFLTFILKDQLEEYIV